MESCFPCPAGLPFRPVRSGGRSYRTESARTFPIISRFGYSSGMDTSGFSYTSCHRAEWHFSVSGIPALPDGSCQQPVQVLISALSTYDNRAEPKARKFYPFSRPVRRASGWQNSVRSGRKNPCEQHDQTGRKHLQTLSQILALSYHLCKEIPAVYEGNPEPAGKPWTQWHSWTGSNPLSHRSRHNKRHWAIYR